MKKYEVRRELWQITEMRDGCVYDTKFVETRWVDIKDSHNRYDVDPIDPPDGHIWVACNDGEPSIRVKK